MTNTANKGSRFTSVSGAARTLGVSEATVRRLLDDGRLAGERLADSGDRIVEVAAAARLARERARQRTGGDGAT